MKRRGEGHSYEIIMGVLFLVLVLAFYSSDTTALVPPFLLLIGGVMLVGGMAIKEPSLMAGGVAMLAVALIYYDVVV